MTGTRTTSNAQVREGDASRAVERTHTQANEVERRRDVCANVTRREIGVVVVEVERMGADVCAFGRIDGRRSGTQVRVRVGGWNAGANENFNGFCETKTYLDPTAPSFI